MLLFLLCSFLCFLLFTFTAGGFFSRFSIGAQFCGQLRALAKLPEYSRADEVGERAAVVAGVDVITNANAQTIPDIIRLPCWV